MEILTSGKAFPASNYLDVTGVLKRSQLVGGFLEEDEIYDLKVSLQTILQILKYLSEEQEAYPLMYEASSRLNLDETLYDYLERKIDERGKVRDDASPALSEIRLKMSRSSGKARNAVTKIMREANKSGYCPEGASITVRDGRVVIPILAEHKRRIKGFVHDESATGQTVYLEPAEALEINNELRELEYAERREVVRILTDITEQVRFNVDELEAAWKLLGVVDFIRAKARFAHQLNCICPELQSKQSFEWKRARHPLLEATLKEQAKEVVPLDIKLGGEGRILLISGPNAGGKSVCLKTIGLVQYTLQCGIPVPCEENSTFGIFQSLYLDIGDEQSIENDLSTYSSHLKNMKFFLEHANKKTLFLIDEFGTGTEPQFGGAIAEVILQTLSTRHVTGAATTHYGNLKKLADKTNGIVNGSMRYDVKKLEPLYELEIGKPGSSFALEIAGKIGLDKAMLEGAKKLAGHSHVRFDRLINELEVEKTALEKRVKDVSAKEKRLDEAIKDYNELKDYLEHQKSKAVKEAKEEAQRIVKESNRRVEATIKEIQETKADKRKTQAARERLKSYEQNLERGRDGKSEKAESIEPLKEGDKVRLKDRDNVGEVLSLKGKKVEIAIGSIKSLVKADEVEKISNKSYKELSHDRIRKMSGIDMNAKMSSFSSNLDIRGTRAEEAIGKVESFVDEAILLGQTELRVIHGKGHGILRETIRNILRENPRVIAMTDEHVEMGGSGVTIISLNQD